MQDEIQKNGNAECENVLTNQVVRLHLLVKCSGVGIGENREKVIVVFCVVGFIRLWGDRAKIQCLRQSGVWPGRNLYLQTWRFCKWWDGTNSLYQ